MNRWHSQAFFNRCRHVMAGSALAMLVAACGTGIEVTEHVTDKDVRRVIDQKNSRVAVASIDAYVDSVPAWKQGKRFWVADNQAKLLLTVTQDCDIDTLALAGHQLVYKGYNTGGLYDNRLTVNLLFDDEATGNSFVYRTDKTIDEFRRAFSIPMLIDMDMVHHVASQIVGKDYFIRTPIWYDRDKEQMIDGRHFIKVRIDSVLPGNSVMPLRVLFTAVDKGDRAMVWMSANAVATYGRDFDALFVASDPRQAHPDISNENWQRITCGQVVEGMTKEECKLSLGTPKHINELPDQSGLKEYWYYDGGSYLFFVDGLLSRFRR